MILPDKLFTVLKWFCMTVSPAICTLLVTLNSLWNWGLPIEAIVGSITGITTFISVILGISNASYYKGMNNNENT